jgi:hypothetical protein
MSNKIGALVAIVFISIRCDKDEELRLDVECNDQRVGIILGLELNENEQISDVGLLRGARIRVGLDVEKQILDNCCSPRTWRQWSRPSEEYTKPRGVTVTANQWNEDFDPRKGSANLPSRAPAGNDENLFDAIFADFPGATSDDIEVEFITCYGCVDKDGLNFRPLACFSWSYEVDDGEIDVDGFDPMDVDDVIALRLPHINRPQHVPPEPF